jgi:AraC-like DNA-binding protein
LNKIIGIIAHKGVLFSLPVIFFIIPLLSFSKRESLVYPGKLPIIFDKYTDDSEQGNSEIVTLADNRKEGYLQFSFILKNAYKFPFTGFSIFFSPDTHFLDISGYDYLKLTIQSEKARSLRVYFKTFVKGYTVLDKFMTHRFLMCEIPVKPATPTLKIPLKEFSTPSWWFEENNLIEAEMAKPDYGKMISMAIESGSNCPRETELTYMISRIAFEKDIRSPLILAIALTLLYFLGYFIAHLLHQRFHDALSPRVVIGYKELDVHNDIDEETKRITDYIAEHFVDSELTVEKLGREVGIHPAKVPGLLKKRFQLNFKQYLNIIRIEEAKRLLRESDKQIVDIAYTVGYNNIPHFNRTFKQATENSPNQYRKQARHPEAQPKVEDEEEE